MVKKVNLVNPLSSILKEVRPKGHYVYLHRRNSIDGDVFYVGKGTGRRAWSTHGRSNPHWFRVARKYGIYVDILKDGLTKDQALSLEVQTIADIGICNLTNISHGGDGGQQGLESKRRKPVHCSNGMTFCSMSAAATWLKEIGHKNAGPGQISLCCSGVLISAYGFIWSTKKINNAEYVNPHERRHKKVYCSNGMEFGSLKSAVEWVRGSVKESADGTCISLAASGKMDSAFGFSWSYEKFTLKEYKEGRTVPKSISSQHGEVFASVSEAVRWLRKNGHPKATTGGVCDVLKGRSVTAYGRTWKYQIVS